MSWAVGCAPRFIKLMSIILFSFHFPCAVATAAKDSERKKRKKISTKAGKIVNEKKEEEGRGVGHEYNSKVGSENEGSSV